MALLAISLTIEVIILLIAIFFMDGGFITRLTSIGLFVINIPLIFSKQLYISDLTSPPTTVGLFFDPTLTNGFVLINVFGAFITLALILLNLRVLLLAIHLRNASEAGWKKFLEEFV